MAVARWSERSREWLGEALPRSLLIIPTGATEQHGPHLATGHDALSVETIALMAAERVADEISIVLAPTLAFGSSGHHLPFGGTLSLSTETYYLVVFDLLASAIRGGANRIFLLNGHGGNHELNQLAARQVALDESSVSIAAASYWDIAAPSLDKLPDFAGRRLPGHAGFFETSLMLAMRPEMVSEEMPMRERDPSDMPRLSGVRIERSRSWQSFDGYTDYPHQADAALGERALDIIVQDVADVFAAFSSSGLH